MRARKYGGAYIRGSEAGLANNLRGKEAEDFLEAVLKQLGFNEGSDYFKQLRVPYMSEERFRKISASYKFINDKPEQTSLSIDGMRELVEDFLRADGGPNIQEDFAIGSRRGKWPAISTILSVTQANPTKPGHSIENKLHQALGELYLHKMHNPLCRSILFVGGNERGWATPSQYKTYGCSYALSVLKLFFDDVVFSWAPKPRSRIERALSCRVRNSKFWQIERERADGIVLDTDTMGIPSSNLRAEFIRKILLPLSKKQLTSSSQITNSVAKFMIDCSLRSNTNFYEKIAQGDQQGIETDRAFNNPPEAAIALLIKQAGLKYAAEIEHGKASVIVENNLLYHLGFHNMHRYTDFVLKAKNGKPVYVESKSAGGGFEGGHKHITDRAREQIARSLLHRTTLGPDKEIVSNPPHYHWIFVLDADWCTPKVYPHKFVHVLQLAGANRWFSARSLTNSNYEPDPKCKFISYMSELCV